MTIGPNSELNAETGENWNIGMVFQVAGFDGSIDLWNVEIEDVVNSESRRAEYQAARDADMAALDAKWADETPVPEPSE